MDLFKGSMINHRSLSGPVPMLWRWIKVQKVCTRIYSFTQIRYVRYRVHTNPCLFPPPPYPRLLCREPLLIVVTSSNSFNTPLLNWMILTTLFFKRISMLLLFLSAHHQYIHCKINKITALEPDQELKWKNLIMHQAGAGVVFHHQ